MRSAHPHRLPLRGGRRYPGHAHQTKTRAFDFFQKKIPHKRNDPGQKIFWQKNFREWGIRKQAKRSEAVSGKQGDGKAWERSGRGGGKITHSFLTYTLYSPTLYSTILYFILHYATLIYTNFTLSMSPNIHE